MGSPLIFRSEKATRGALYLGLHNLSEALPNDRKQVPFVQPVVDEVQRVISSSIFSSAHSAVPTDLNLLIARAVNKAS